MLRKEGVPTLLQPPQPTGNLKAELKLGAGGIKLHVPVEIMRIYGFQFSCNVPIYNDIYLHVCTLCQRYIGTTCLLVIKPMALLGSSVLVDVQWS